MPYFKTSAFASLLSAVLAISALANENELVARDDCDFVALNQNNLAFTGTVHVAEIEIQTTLLPDPLKYRKEDIAYIHFEQLPYQPADFIQLISGGSVEGRIVGLDEVTFTDGSSGNEIPLPRSSLLAFMFRCNMRAVANAYVD